MIAALDIGGTKVHGAIVDQQGKILKQLRQAVRVSEGPDAFFKQLIDILTELSRDHKINQVGIGCAGPLDGQTGELLDPTNFFTNGKSWGRISLLRPLQQHFKNWQFTLDNDAAAAVLGEAWLGGLNTNNLAVITLGTGVGIGLLVEGQLVRTRAGLHPETSHIPLNYGEKSFPCGCGNFGCIEAYLAGSHMLHRLALKWQKPSLSGEQLVDLLQAGESKAQSAMAEYGEWLAQTIHALAVLFGPEHVSLTGGFATTAPWFLPTVQRRLPELLARRRAGVDFLPQVKVSRLNDDLSVLGAARVGLLAK